MNIEAILQTLYGIFAEQNDVSIEVVISRKENKNAVPDRNSGNGKQN